MFFKNPENAEILASFLRKTETAHIEDKARANRLSRSRKIIGYISNSPAEWDKGCTFNIKHLGGEFLGLLRNFDQKGPTDIDLNLIYAGSYRFLCEFNFLVEPGKEPNKEMESLQIEIQCDSDEMNDKAKYLITHASYQMPAVILRDLINEKNSGIFKDFEQKKIEAEKLKEQWDGEIKSKESTVQALKDKLEEYEIGFNFVGLYRGFSDLAKKKAKESSWLFRSLIGMGLLILTPLVAQIVSAVMGIYSGKPLSVEHLLILIPVISIEIILIYFFRIVLLNHRSVKAQIMQIELRQTLCQFIQSYTEYSANMKKEDSSALEKFEGLIFSGILSDPEKLPSTFDGVEQIGNFIKSMKKS